jgi:ABC-type transport system involved in cytochrome c biogenesis ATPase subunit
MHLASLQVKGLSFRQPHVQLFADWSAAFQPGLTWVTGDEGVGKTTLLRLLAGDWLMATGSVHWQDAEGVRLLAPADVYWVDPADTARDDWTVHAYAAACQARYPRWSQATFNQWAEVLSLTEHLDKFLYMLSTGSKRKVWLAGALAAHATVTLLDEPEAALDVPSRRALRAELARCNQGGDGVWLVASYSCPIDGDPSQTLSLGS